MLKKIHDVFEIAFNDNIKNITTLLKASGLSNALVNRGKANKLKIIIKPNIVNDSPPPITTPFWVVKKLVEFIQDVLPNSMIIIADGTGELSRETLELFEMHGYTKNIKMVEFLDLNHEECIKIKLKNGRKWDFIYLPKILFDAFLISVPVLKAHTLAGVTLSMKNMIGACPPKYYQQDGHWKKSAFHSRVHEAIFDLNCARTPDFILLDASIGMAQSHLGGPKCNPPVNKFLASFDPVAIDAYGAALLGKSWRDIGHIQMADGIIGSASSSQVITIN